MKDSGRVIAQVGENKFIKISLCHGIVGVLTETGADGSQRGNRVMFWDDFKFNFQKELACVELRWVFAGNQKFSCKAYLRTIIYGQVVVS